MADYPTLGRSIDSLTAGETYTVTLMARLACGIHATDERVGWTGFYRVTEPGLLKIGPYRGGHGCVAEIPRRRQCPMGCHFLRRETAQAVPEQLDLAGIRHRAPRQRAIVARCGPPDDRTPGG